MVSQAKEKSLNSQAFKDTDKREKAIPLTDIEKDFDSQSHAVIEASAGTGKTYAIQKITMQLIEAGIDLTQILIVTFTEKATGELKDRIRKEVEEHIEKGLDREGFFRKALESFENAQISTIHGFCNRVLKETAFENGGYFKYEIVDDQEVYQKNLRQLMRKDWPERYGESLPDKLVNFKVSENWERRVTSLASKWTPEAGERLYPSDNEIKNEFEKGWQILAELSRVAGDIDEQNLEENHLYQAYSQLNFSNSRQKQFKNNRLTKTIGPMLQLIVEARKSDILESNEKLELKLTPLLKNFIEPQERIAEFRELGFNYLCEHSNGGYVCDNIEDAYPHIKAVIDLLQHLYRMSSFFDIDGIRFKRDTVEKLKSDVCAYKDQNSLISYDDMLVKLHAALDPRQNNNASGLLADLRAQYRYALVDEFQDTDAVQWEIFKAIFVADYEQTANRLIVVGDPKQAIYSFRGADVYVYLKAKDYLLKKTGAKLYNLPVNYRSAPALMDCLNPVFKSPYWFGDSQCRVPVSIGYVDVNSPVKNRRAFLYQDNTGLKPVVLMEDEDKKTLPNRIAREVSKLLQPGMLFFEDANAEVKGTGRYLRADDICVLVRSRFDALKIEKALHRYEIPYAYYKKDGIFESEEALNLCYLLKAIAEPDKIEAFKKMLLTRFFNIPAERLKAYEDLSPKHPIRERFQNWQELSQKRQWPLLFKAIFNDTGILYRESALHDGDRRIVNYIHIVQELETAAHLNNMDITGLADYLFKLKAKVIKLGEKADLHRIETERPKVQIMTIHASKGLEYPVVFLAGGFKDIRKDADGKFHHPEDNSVLYDLIQLVDFEPFHRQEAIDEARRLFYVALTRAIYKLYLPFQLFSPGENEVPYPTPEEVSQKLDSPVETFLSRSIEDAHGLDNPQLKMPDVILDELPPPNDPVKADDLENKPENLYNLDYIKQFKINRKFHAAHRLNTVDSYKTLKSIASKTSYAIFEISRVPHFFADETPETRDDETDEMDQINKNNQNQESLELPPGKNTGDLIHHILENVDFREVAEARNEETLLQEQLHTSAIIHRALEKYRFASGTQPSENPYALPAARMVWKAIHHPLASDGFCLGALGTKDRIAELEFYYSLPNGLDTTRDFNQTIPEVTFSRKGYLTGKIDLVFKRANHVFIVDWKTNTLRDGYHTAALINAMEKENYHLQYQLYALAVKRWITQLPQSPALEFKGVYYLFLRGLDPDSPDQGIFFYQPTATDLEHYQEQLEKLVDLRQKVSFSAK